MCDFVGLNVKVLTLFSIIVLMFVKVLVKVIISVNMLI